jgi:hypothetical protein
MATVPATDPFDPDQNIPIDEDGNNPPSPDVTISGAYLAAPVFSGSTPPPSPGGTRGYPISG